MSAEVAGRRSRTRNGFTILELLIVVAIIGVLIGLVVPAVSYARASSRRISCSNHLRQLALATQNYHDSWGVFPPWVAYRVDGGKISGPLHRLLPFLEQASATNTLVKIPLLVCPADGQATDHPYGLSYLMSGGPSSPHFGNWGGIARRLEIVCLRDVTDGASQTISWGERLHLNPQDSDIRRWIHLVQTPAYSEQAAARLCNDGPRVRQQVPPSYTNTDVGWATASLVALSHMVNPNRPFCQGMNNEFVSFRMAGSEHAGGVYVAFVDGHVQFVSNSVNEATWFAMGTPAGGESLSLP